MEKEEYYFGRALPECITDIIRGAKKEEAVLFIATDLSIKDKDHFDRLVASWAKKAWTSSPEMAETGIAIAERLWQANKIVSTRGTSDCKHRWLKAEQGPPTTNRGNKPPKKPS
jgi:hypothetical protein